MVTNFKIGQETRSTPAKGTSKPGWGGGPPQPSKSKHKRRRVLTFKDLIAEARLSCAQQAWKRATVASSLRHLMHTRRYRGQTLVAKVKHQGMIRALQICPERVKLNLDDTYQLGMPSIRFLGMGQLHIPWTALSIHLQPGTGPIRFAA